MRGELGLVVMQLRSVSSRSDEEVGLALDNADERCRRRSRFIWDLDPSQLSGQIRVDGFPDLDVPAVERVRLGNSYRW